MATKKYYWLKLKKEFFKQKTIKKMRTLPGGDVYALIFLEMLTIATETEGIIYYEGIEKSPEEELALALDEDVNAVKMTVNMLRMLHLLEDCQNGDFFLPDAVKMTGSESESAERVRRMRENRKREEEKQLAAAAQKMLPAAGDDKSKKNEPDLEALHCNTDVTKGNALHCNGTVTDCNEDITGIIPNMPPDESGKIGTIPNMPASENGGQKVKNDIKAASVADLNTSSDDQSVTLYKNVQNCNEHKEIEIELDKEKELNINTQVDLNISSLNNLSFSIQPSNNNNYSSLKSDEYSNNNIARARTVEESEKTETDHPDKPSTQPVDSVKEEGQSLDGGMDGKDNTKPMPEAELEAVFQKFRENYPRHAGKMAAIRKVFREMVYLQKVDPYDLVTAAAKYAEKVKAEETPEKYMKMPQNFMLEMTWMRYIPIYQEHCPKCHGKGIYEDWEDGRCIMVYCDCNDRYKRLYSQST